jgi:hypothetical protein
MKAAAGRIVLVLAGLAALGWGVAGFVSDPGQIPPSNALAWLAGGVVLHDAVLVPAVTLLGLALSRAVPAPYRSVVAGGLIVSGSVALASLPLWRGYGGAPGNPSVDPLPYGRNLLIVLGIVWAVAAGIMAVRAARRRRPSPRTGPGPAGRSRRAK